MIKQLLATIWRFFDVIFFTISMIFINIFAFSFGNRWGFLSIAITSFLVALASELLAYQMKGGNE
ncbi:DUF1056 family protein [Fructobacillus cardui]|uniref:DUF1056 family protein n=1 Tax=Fructobacillus cardui TaxID=2893170 RepID=UPI00200AF9D2|nr:DUF1056 family protein [Fructobacillus cardui]MCK8626670.1 DUF1056 family protein [Fructobacillus cardui]